MSQTTTVGAAEHLAALVESSRDAIISKALDGTVQSWNSAAERIFGYSAEEIIGRSVLLIVPPERHHEENAILEKLKKGERIEHFETVRLRKDGSLVDVSISVSPILDASGQVIGGSKIARDVSERRRSDTTAYRFAAIVESSQDAIISKSLLGIIESWNASAERLFGYRADEIIGKSVLTLIPPDRQHEEEDILRRIRSGERIEHFETVRQHKDGTFLDISLTISPVKGARGEIIGASKIARDIRDRKRAEATRELLLHEIKHRVKNTLAAVQAIVTQTFRNAPQEERSAFSSRLQAFSSAHDLLTQKNWQSATMPELAQRALKPFGNRINPSGPPIELGPSKTLVLAMILHELGTNATKYGALSNETGYVHLTWELEDGIGERYAHLKWQETGGPPVSKPQRAGFGTRMIERSLKAEGGDARLLFDPTGLICSVKVSLNP